MKSRPKVVAFDVVETLFSLEPLRAQLDVLGLTGAALEIWFVRLLRNAFALDASGVYKPFGEVARATLEVFLVEKQLAADAPALDQALAGFAELPAYADVAPAFQLLHEAGVRIVTLTNGHADTTRRLLEHARLNHFVERVISIDEVRRWKPAREVSDLSKTSFSAEKDPPVQFPERSRDWVVAKCRICECPWDL